MILWHNSMNLVDPFRISKLRSNLSNFDSAMVGCSQTSCTYPFFFRFNISNAVPPTINLIRIIELRHNQTRTKKMLNWFVPVSTGSSYPIYDELNFDFQILSEIQRKKENSRSRINLIPFGRISSKNSPWLFMSPAWPLDEIRREVG